MLKHSDDRELLTRDFLGVASAHEREAVEEKYFAVDSSVEAFLRAEEEVIDDYVRGALNTSERVLFEENFLCSAERRQRLEFTKSLVEALAETESGELSSSSQDVPSRFSAVTGRSQEEPKTGVFLGTPQGQPALADRQELFSSLLGWLDPVRERAAEKYETIRNRLIRMFASRGIVDAEELADETIDRVSSSLAEQEEKYSGDPTTYFYRVANHVLRQSLRARARGQMLQEMDIQASSGDEERVHSCLQKCLGQLSNENRELILQYGSEKKAKFAHRKHLAESLGMSVDSLRIRALKIRRSLQKCVESCLARSQ